MIRFQRLTQIFCLGLFLRILSIVSFSGISLINADLFLQMDPGLVLISAISSRIVLISFIPAVLVLLLTPFAGRIFCGYICPMGTTVDFTDYLFRYKNKRYLFSKNLLKIKYLVLIFLVGSAFFGVSYVFFASPLSR